MAKNEPVPVLEFTRSFKTQRRSFATVELPRKRVREIAKIRMDPRHNHLNAILDRN
jgi:hypothetical protein